MDKQGENQPNGTSESLGRCGLRAVALLACAVALVQVSATFSQVGLDDVTDQLLPGDPASSGVAWVDVNNDDYLDLLVATLDNERGVRLFLNQEGEFREVTAQSGIDAPGGNGIATGDFDNDGHMDLFITATGWQSRLFHGEGLGQFTDVSDPAGVEVQGDLRSSASFADYDNDGLLDLFVGDIFGSDDLFRNLGNGRFLTSSVSAGVADPRATPHHMFADLDGDGFMDLYVPNNYALHAEYEGKGDAYYHNEGDGTFLNIAGQMGIEHDRAVEAVVAFDSDNDGDLDLLLTSIAFNSGNLFYRNLGDGSFFDDTQAAQLGDPASVFFGATAADFDNDGWTDLLVTDTRNSQLSLLLRNNADGSFSQVAREAGLGGGKNFIASVSDFDRDGFLDLYLSNRMPSTDKIYRGQSNGNHWLHISLIGSQSNRSAIGAGIRVSSGDLTMYRQVHGGNGYGGGPPPVEFGLGRNTTADLVEITWPSGAVTRLENVAADGQIRVIEGIDGYTPVTGSTATSVLATDTVTPTIPALRPAYPNPFNGAASIRYALPGPGWVNLAVFDMIGQEVLLLEEGHKTAGEYQTMWLPAPSRGSGIYFVRLVFSGTSAYRRLVFIK
ncbi:MAG: T9SS type A sorting domain-containing protein [Candidatus Latescibacteria bacterium]|nr:T9SS type A sorting domain-containing protein [Candidatus Latescibacterota bacterium]